MSWLSSFWDHNRNFLGNAMKNVSPFAFLIPGVGPLAAAGLAGAGSALGRGIQKGANFGDIAKQGIQGAGQAYLGGKLTGGEGKSLSNLRRLFTGGGNASPAAQSAREVAANAGKVNPISFTPSSAGAPGAGAGGIPGISVTPSAITGPGPSVASLPGSLSSGLRSASPGFLKQAALFAKDNPMAVGMGLQGAGQLAAMPAENRLKRAQQAQIEYENERQRARDEALAPLWKLIEAQVRGRFS